MAMVSVIVPNFNHAFYLKQRFDSIFNQTFKDFEVIILDDCSTDTSKEIIEEYRNNPKVKKIIYNEENGGSPFKQWAKGFKLAQGEYIWIAESDDWAEPVFLETMVSTLQKNPTALLAFSNSRWFSEKGTLKYSNVYQQDTFIDGKIFFNKKMITQNSICNASCVLFKRNVLNEIPTQYQSFKGCGDWLFWIEFCLKGDVCYVCNVLNHFRQHEKSTTQRNNNSGNAYKEYFRIFRYLKEQKKISFFRRHCMAVFFITFPKKNPDVVKKSPDIYKYICQEWRKEIWSPLISRLFVDVIFVFWNIKKFFFSLLGKEIEDFF